MKRIYFAILIIILIIPLSIFGFFRANIVNKSAFFPNKTNFYNFNRAYIQEIYLKVNPREKIHTYYFSKNSNKKVILFFHGNGGNSSFRLPRADKSFKMGFNVLLVDYRGYGKSTGTPSEINIYKDAEISFNYLINTLKYSSENIYILGRSIGTTAAVDIAQNKNIAGLILVSPLSNAYQLLEEKNYKYIKFISFGIFDNLKKIKNVKSKLLIIHGTKDKIIPYKNAKNLYNAFNGEKKFVTIQGGNHNNLEKTNPLLFWNSIRNFLK